MIFQGTITDQRTGRVVQKVYAESRERLHEKAAALIAELDAAEAEKFAEALPPADGCEWICLPTRDGRIECRCSCASPGACSCGHESFGEKSVKVASHYRSAPQRTVSASQGNPAQAGTAA